jgi:hypothetical protein
VERRRQRRGGGTISGRGKGAGAAKVATTHTGRCRGICACRRLLRFGWRRRRAVLLWRCECGLRVRVGRGRGRRVRLSCIAFALQSVQSKRQSHDSSIPISIAGHSACAARLCHPSVCHPSALCVSVCSDRDGEVAVQILVGLTRR